MTKDDELLIEQVVSAWRPRDTDGGVRAHPAWYDLPSELREDAAKQTRRQRRMEAALDPEGLSSTAKAVLARIRGLPVTVIGPAAVWPQVGNDPGRTGAAPGERILTAARSGKMLKRAIPSSANASILRKGYLVAPAARAARSYSTAVCLKPIQATRPRTKRCVSRSSRIATMTRRLIRRKSPVSSGTSMGIIAAKTR